MKFSPKECATVLAALRLWQDTVVDTEAGVSDEWADFFSREIPPLSAEEIDKLCEQINFDTEVDTRYRREKIDVALGDMARGEPNEGG